MTSKILKSILSVAVAVLLATLLVITGVLYRYFGSVQQSQLRDALTLAAGGTEQMGKDYLETVASDRYRLTWVGADGGVLFDSRAEAGAMENHGDREEILEAKTTGIGSSARYSNTLLEQTLYEAVRLEDGSILRISVSSATAALLVLGMMQPVAWIVILAIALSAWLAHRMAKRVVEPLNKLDLEHPLENKAYEELSPLLGRIHAQHLEIRNQMRILKRKQDEFDQITGNMKEALVLLDASGRIVSVNPTAKKLFGIETFQIGDDFLAVDRRQSMRQAVADARERGQAVFRTEILGREYQVGLSRIDSEGSVQGIVVLAFDVTEQVNAERNRREFTANVSHELKTPLQTIIGSAELLENGFVKEADVPQFVGKIRQEATRLVSLINDIIRLSRLDEGGEMNREAVSLRLLSEEVCDVLADAAREKRITLRVSGAEGRMTGVHQLLFEVIYNLCDNAIRYNHPGGAVEVDIAEGPEALRLQVRDTGIGIAPEHQEKVFERFYRVDKSHSRQSGGTGLGLSIVKHAVQLHGGHLEMESEPGRGTAITAVFPVT